MSDSRVSQCLAHGISFNGLQHVAAAYRLLDVFLAEIEGVGIFIVDAPGVCDEAHTIEDAELTGCNGGGIVAVRSGVCIRDSGFAFNSIASIAMFQSAALIERCGILFTLPTPDSRYGDGLMVSALDFPSVVTIRDSLIAYSNRGGIAVFGSELTYQDVEMVCGSFDLVVDDLGGFPYVIHNDGSNLCGCPYPPGGNCLAESGSFDVSPPAPLN